MIKHHEKNSLNYSCHPPVTIFPSTSASPSHATCVSAGISVSSGNLLMCEGPQRKLPAEISRGWLTNHIFPYAQCMALSLSLSLKEKHQSVVPSPGNELSCSLRSKCCKSTDLSFAPWKWTRDISIGCWWKFTGISCGINRWNPEVFLCCVFLIRDWIRKYLKYWWDL